MKMKLNPKHVTMNELLGSRLFRIPDYQRAYAWGRKQRLDLFNDILEVQKTGQEHFMATTVCLAKDVRRIGADQYQAVEVVDGQQRITTFIILIKAVEKTLSTEKTDEAKIKAELSELLIKSDDHSLLLLQTNHDNCNIFANYLRKGEICDDEVRVAADQNLIDAAKECEQFVKEWGVKKSLIELVSIIRHSISLIYHELNDEAIVYRVFEVLNSRGLDVKWIDKLKSQLMALIYTYADDGARADALEEMRGTWQDIYRVLGLRADLGDEAVRFAGTWKSKVRPNRILSELDATVALTKCAGTKLKTIGETGAWLKQVVDAVYKLDEDVRLHAVTRIIHARFLAIAIFLRQFPEQIEKKLLEQWERVSFRIFGLANKDSRHKIGDYVRLAYDVLAENISYKQIEKELRVLGEGYSIDEVLKIVDWGYSYEGWTEELRYLLYRYDEHLAYEAGEKINQGQWNKIWKTDPSKSIEHIKPQSSNVEYAHHLGNLTMLPPSMNSSLQDKPPKDKAKAYKRCGLRATMDIGEFLEDNSWNKQAVDARAERIIQFVRKEWAD